MKLTALLIGTALALVPSGTAYAGATGNGQALGNCQNSSKGGEKVLLAVDTGPGKGNGGLRHLDGACTTTTVVDDTGTDTVEPDPYVPSDG